MGIGLNEQAAPNRRGDANGSPGSGSVRVNHTKSRVPANLHRLGTNRSRYASSRSHLEPCGADVARYRHSGAEPPLDEVLLEPVIRLVMKRDNVTEDQLRHFIRIASRHINR
jgi:hypothetical protein